MATPIRPIWDNEPLVRADIADEYLDYHVLCDGASIYNGRAYKRPDTGKIEVAINSLCAPYLSAPFPASASPEAAYGFDRSPNMKRLFRFEAEGSAANLDTDVEFYADWSFDPHRDPRPALASDPVTGEVSPRQVVLTSFYDHPGPIDVSVVQNGAARSFTIPAAAGAAGVAWVGLGSGYDGATELTVGNASTGTVKYRIVDDCRHFALYYLNAYGGWDSILLFGAPKESNEYTRTTYKQAYALSTQTGARIPRGTVNFQNDYTKAYECSTGWLSDEQAARLDHLFGSVDVYLCDLLDNRFIPVVLTDSTFEYKTYRNQGAHLVSYTLQVQAAIDFTRQ